MELVILGFTILNGVVGFFLTAIYKQFQDLNKTVNKIHTEVKVQEKRTDDLERRIMDLEN